MTAAAAAAAGARRWRWWLRQHGDDGGTATEAARRRRRWRQLRIQRQHDSGGGGGGGTATEAARRGRRRWEEAFSRCCSSCSLVLSFWVGEQPHGNLIVRSFLSSVFGPSVLEKRDTKVCRYSKNHVAKIGLTGQKLATFRLVADMSPTCRRHYQPRKSVVASLLAHL
jgi:hypothetical protein